MTSPVERIIFLLGMFQMSTIVFVSGINHYQINGSHLFWDTLYDDNSRNKRNLKTKQNTI